MCAGVRWLALFVSGFDGNPRPGEDQPATDDIGCLVAHDVPDAASAFAVLALWTPYLTQGK